MRPCLQTVLATGIFLGAVLKRRLEIDICNEDVAEYACVTENVQDKIHIELKASETPALAKLPEVMAASRGKDVKLSCKLNNPNDKVQWQKRGKFLLDEKSKFSKYSVDRGILFHDSLQQTVN